MNQAAIELAVQNVMPAAAATGLFVSLCTIQQRTGAVSLTGQVDLTDWNDIDSLSNIPCQFSIVRPATPNMAATLRMPAQTDSLTQFHALLDGYFPSILQSNQAVVDGTAYEIVAVESDSQKTQTRLGLRAYGL